MKRLSYLFLLLVCSIGTDAQTVRVKAPLKSEHYIVRNGNLDNALYRIRKEKTATVAFLGGSITHMDGWRNMVCKYLSDTYRGTHFNFIAAGIPSLGSLPHAFRFQRDVVDKGKVDLLFIESAVNDHVNGTNEITQRRALEGIIRHMLTANPDANIVLMAFVDPDKMVDYNAGKIPTEVQVHAEMARKYGLPFINLAKEITDRINNKEFTWSDDFKDLHPSPFGQRLYFNTIRQLLEGAFKRPVPNQVVAAKMPLPADTFNYQDANYADIHNATNLQGFTLTESWQPTDSTPTRPGFVQVPVLVSDSSGGSLEFSFTGRAVGIGVLSGPDAGTIQYSIDGAPMQEKDLYTEWSNILYLPWYLILGDGLTPEKHILRLQTGAPHTGSTQNRCRIVYFLVNK